MDMARSARRPSRPSVAVGVIAALVLGLAACGSESDDGVAVETETTTTTTTTIVDAAASETTPPTTEAPTTLPPTTIPETTLPPTTTLPDPADCLVGQWRLRSQEFLDEIVSTLPPEATGGLAEWTHISGEYLIDLNADGTSRGQRLAWTHRLATAEGALVTTIDSDDAGSYTVDGDMISVTDEASSATVSLAVEIDGQLQSIPFGQNQQVGTDALSGSGTYECVDDVLTITITDLPDAPPGGITAILDRV